MQVRDRWPLSGLDDVRDALLAAYGDPARGYHDLLHLTEVLDRVDELAAETADPTTVRLAAWFHDAVYDGARDDEERSAAWAAAALTGTAYAEEVARLVRVTAGHRPAADDRDGAVLCDADLAVLAAPAARYTAYVAGVRAEYAAYSDAEFAAGRAQVLGDLLAGPLFHTASGRARWDAAARANVAAELAELTRTGG